MATTTPLPRAELTERQQEMLDFIRSEVASRGFPPSIREIGKALGISSPNGVECHLKALIRKGYLSREGNMSRSLRLLGDASSHVDRLERSHAALITACKLALSSSGPLGNLARAAIERAVKQAEEVTS